MAKTSIPNIDKREAMWPFSWGYSVGLEEFYQKMKEKKFRLLLVPLEMKVDSPKLE